MIALPFPDFQALVRNIPFSGYEAPAEEIPKHQPRRKTWLPFFLASSTGVSSH
jgi:hypothetical protein